MSVYSDGAMPFVSLTRLRLRSVRFLPFFAFHTLRSIAQVKRAPGFEHGALLNDRHWAFWTLTLWDHHDSMRRYMITGDHKRAMPHLLHWCDEASVAHWDQAEAKLPTWEEADERMRKIGRASKVLHPSPRHAGLSYEAPRTSRGGPIAKAKRSAP